MPDLLPGLLEATAVAGEVRTLSDQPLEGVTLRVGNQTAGTDETGRFLLSSISPGHHVLVIDGRTASTPGQIYGVFEVGIDMRAGRTNVLPFTIWMPEIDTENAVSIPSPTPDEVVVTTPRIPGFELHLPPGTIIRDKDGHAVSQISITPIPVDRPPFPLPFGAEFTMYFTVQPGGAYIEPYGARIIYPNITGESPGTRMYFWNYDPEEKGWHIYGLGKVTPDGRQVVPDSGVVIWKFAGASPHPFKKKPKRRNCTDGEPVDLGTGLFVLRKTDLFLPDVMPITLTRTHRPGFELQGLRPFGIGSGHPYELFLFLDFQFQWADLILPDGDQMHYPRISPGTEAEGAVFEHTETPSEFFMSQIKKARNSWELTLTNGTSYTFSEDTAPVLQSIQDRYGNSISIARPRAFSHERATRVISPNGRWLEFTPDVDDIDGKVIQVRDNIGRVVTYDYDDRGDLTKVTDPRGGVTEYTYDVHRIRTIKDARGIIFLTNEYDDEDRVVRQIQADGSTYEFEYTVDANGNITQTLVTDPRGNIRRVTFNADGYMLSDTHAVGAPEEQTTIYERQATTNLVLSVTDALGRKNAYAYDAMGNITSIKRLAGTPDEVAISLSYEPRFNQIATIADPLGHTIVIEYDDRGNVSSVIDPLGNQTTFASTSAGQPLSITDPLGNTTHLTYERGDVVGMTDPLGHTTTREVDSGGRPIVVTDSLGHNARYAYDVLNRVVQIIDSASTGPIWPTDIADWQRMRGSAVGVSLPRATDRLSSTPGRLIDKAGPLPVAIPAQIKWNMLVALSDTIGFNTPQAGMTALEYDSNANLLMATDARGSITKYTYDDMDRPARRRDALGRSESYLYDAGGNLTQITDRKGQVKTFKHDSLNRLTQVAFADASTIAYAYDGGNRLIRAVDSVSGTFGFAYDNLDRLTEESNPQGTISYSYDAAGRRTSMTVAGQPPVFYTYDEAGYLTRLARGSLIVTLAYDSAHRRTHLGYPNGLVADYDYDAASQLIGITYKVAGTVLGDLSYEYDETGNRIKVGGSLARTGLPQAISSPSYDAANQLTQWGTGSLSHDANGSLTSDGLRNYVWDARNQLASTSGPGVAASFRYDAFGRRISKAINGAATEFLYDGLRVVQELSGGMPSANLLGGNRLDEYFARISQAGMHAMLTDGLGSTLALVSSAGAAETRYTYEPFGNVTLDGALPDNLFQYTGRENDGDGLYYYRTRYYSPVLQRFISEDRIDRLGVTNLFTYVRNNPLRYVDPLGLSLGKIGHEILEFGEALGGIPLAAEGMEKIAAGAVTSWTEEAVGGGMLLPVAESAIAEVGFGFVMAAAGGLLIIGGGIGIAIVLTDLILGSRQACGEE